MGVFHDSMCLMAGISWRKRGREGGRWGRISSVGPCHLAPPHPCQLTVLMGYTHRCTRRYEGDWFNDQMHGKGVYVSAVLWDHQFR